MKNAGMGWGSSYKTKAKGRNSKPCIPGQDHVHDPKGAKAYSAQRGAPVSIHKPQGEWVYGIQSVKAAIAGIHKQKRSHFFTLYVRDSLFDTRADNVMCLINHWRHTTGKGAKLVDKQFLGNILQDKLHQVSF